VFVEFAVVVELVFELVELVTKDFPSMIKKDATTNASKRISNQ